MKWACPSTSSCPFAARPKRSIATRGEPHAYARRIVRKAALQIGVHRHVGRRDHRLKMREREVARDRVVGIGLPKGKARARGGQRLEAEMLQVARAADIPRNIGGPETFRARAAKKPTCTFGWTG